MPIEFTGSICPPDPDFSSFASVWNQDYWLLEHFWHSFGNSVYHGPRHGGADGAHRVSGEFCTQPP